MILGTRETAGLPAAGALLSLENDAQGSD